MSHRKTLEYKQDTDVSCPICHYPMLQLSRIAVAIGWLDKKQTVDSVIHKAEALARTNFVQRYFTLKLFCINHSRETCNRKQKPIPMKKYNLSYGGFHKVLELFRFPFDFMSSINCVSKGAIFYSNQLAILSNNIAAGCPRLYQVIHSWERGNFP